MNPKVFLSHASDDKDRFVLKFAEKLRANGVDAWLDKWEMLPGDSLVQKIFEEGIKNADALIVILSKHSIHKKWVKEELNVGMVNKINQNSKLIPVVIDDCEIPECLAATLRVRIADIENYDVEFQRILYSIFDRRDKPPLGESPPYSQNDLSPLEGLSKLDTLLIKTSCELAIRDGHCYVEAEDLIKKVEIQQFPLNEITDSLNYLQEMGYIEGSYVVGLAYPPTFRITLLGFNEYANAYLTEYTHYVAMVMADLVNNDGGDNSSLSEKLEIPRLIVDYIIELLEGQELVKANRYLGGGFQLIDIWDVSIKLRRMVSDI